MLFNIGLLAYPLPKAIAYVAVELVLVLYPIAELKSASTSAKFPEEKL